MGTSWYQKSTKNVALRITQGGQDAPNYLFVFLIGLLGCVGCAGIGKIGALLETSVRPAVTEEPAQQSNARTVSFRLAEGEPIQQTLASEARSSRRACWKNFPVNRTSCPLSNCLNRPATCCG